MKRIAFIGAAVLTAGLVTAAPAAAGVSPHCLEGGYCLFSAPQFGGTKAVLSHTWGHCRLVSSLGFTPARSAARGFGDGAALELYSDTTCTNSVAVVFQDVPDVTALSYAVIPIPG